MSADTVRFRRARVVLGDLHSVARGWYFRFASPVKIDLDDRWHCLSDVSTRIRWRDELLEINRNRMDNMRLSASMLDGIRLQPGEILSLQRMIGDPTEEKGFKKGPMIIRGRLGFTYGGGLCQVSTTLFNAALMADLAILQKYNHSMDIWGEERFVDLGMDATYVFARKDLKFQNTHCSDIVLKVSLREKELLLNCKLFSRAPLARTVHVERRVLKEVLPHVPEPASRYTVIKGWSVRTTRYAGEGDGRMITYRKEEHYKPFVIRKEGT